MENDPKPHSSWQMILDDTKFPDSWTWYYLRTLPEEVIPRRSETILADISSRWRPVMRSIKPWRFNNTPGSILSFFRDGSIQARSWENTFTLDNRWLRIELTPPRNNIPTTYRDRAHEHKFHWRIYVVAAFLLLTTFLMLTSLFAHIMNIHRSGVERSPSIISWDLREFSQLSIIWYGTLQWRIRGSHRWYSSLSSSLCPLPRRENEWNIGGDHKKPNSYQWKRCQRLYCRYLKANQKGTKNLVVGCYAMN